MNEVIIVGIAFIAVLLALDLIIKNRKPEKAGTAFTVGQALDAKLTEARGKVDALKAKSNDELTKAEDDVKKLEAESAALPPHLRDMPQKEVVEHVNGWFKK